MFIPDFINVNLSTGGTVDAVPGNLVVSTGSPPGLVNLPAANKCKGELIAVYGAADVESTDFIYHTSFRTGSTFTSSGSVLVYYFSNGVVWYCFRANDCTAGLNIATL